MRQGFSHYRTKRKSVGISMNATIARWTSLQGATRGMINSRLGQAVKPRIAKALTRLGFELVALKRDERQHLYEILQRFAIGSVVDVGANQGQFGLLVRGLGYSGSILSVEPMDAAFRRLEIQSRGDPLWSVYRAALSHEPGARLLNISGNSTSSSLLAITELHVDAEPTSQTLRTEKVAATTLDEVVGRHGLYPPYFLKIDVQGSEMAVLDGGPNTLARTVALRIESSLRQLYEDSHTLEQVLYRLHRNGFVPVRIEPAFEDPRTGDTLQVDVVACRGELL